MKEFTCCFTGHRILPADRVEQIKIQVRSEAKNLVQQGVRYFGAGGALGFDTLAALTILELKKVCPQLRLILVLPCKDQTRGWLQSDVEQYEGIKGQVDKIVYTSEFYTRGCMQKRNWHLADHSAYCICYLTKNYGGTKYTVDRCRANNVAVIDIARHFDMQQNSTI